MLTLSEYLKIDGNQKVALSHIINILRSTGEWESRGLFSKLADKMDFTPAYIGQVLRGRKAITPPFMLAFAAVMSVDIPSVLGDSIIC